jgi:hypothetical protein
LVGDFFCKGNGPIKFQLILTKVLGQIDFK